jgi:hypothetical protein
VCDNFSLDFDVEYFTKRNQCAVQLAPGGANHEPHAEQLLQAHYVYAMPLFGYAVAPEQNIFLFAAATSHNSAAASLAHTAPRHYYIFWPAGAPTSTC